MHTPGAEVSGFICVLIIQVTFIVVYGIFVRYDDALLPDSVDASAYDLAAIERERAYSYPRKLFLLHQISCHKNSFTHFIFFFTIIFTIFNCRIHNENYEIITELSIHNCAERNLTGGK